MVKIKPKPSKLPPATYNKRQVAVQFAKRPLLAFALTASHACVHGGGGEGAAAIRTLGLELNPSWLLPCRIVHSSALHVLLSLHSKSPLACCPTPVAPVLREEAVRLAPVHKKLLGCSCLQNELE